MQNFLAIFQLVLQLLPIIVDAVRTIERAYPQAGQGVQKLAMVQAILQSAYEDVSNAAVTFEKLWPTLRTAIGTVVALENKLGNFKLGDSKK